MMSSSQQQQQQQHYYRPTTSAAAAAAAQAAPAPKKWLMDRITGQSKYNDRERPPANCCWVSPFVGWFPNLLETNRCCQFFGGMGINNSSSETFRFVCLHLGFVTNIGAMLLTAYACLAISLQYFLLSKASMETMVRTETIVGNDDAATASVVTIYTGFRGVAMDNPALAATETGRQIVVAYDDFCEFAATRGLERYLDPSKDCGSCASIYFSMNAVICTMVSVATFFPTFFSTQLRMYSGYDVNCTKNFLTAVGIITILLNLSVMLTYFFLCSRESFYRDGTVYFDSQGNAFDDIADISSNTYWKVKYEWKRGWGLIFLIAATGLKLMDVLCNIAVPTPSVTRDEKEQDIYETIVFAPPPTGDNHSTDNDDDDENNHHHD